MPEISLQGRAPLLARESTANNTRRGVVSLSPGGHHKGSPEKRSICIAYVLDVGFGR